jgi:hypothetical protein
MSAGYIQLAAIGQQDAYLTGEPQVTYFLGVYRRHTPFVLEAYDIPFLDQKISYNQNHICRIPPKGDLVRSVMLKMTLPALKTTGTEWYWPIPPSVSNAATLIFNGNYTLANVAPYSGIDWYSTYNQTNWLSGSGTAGIFKPNVAYVAGTNKFIFSNVTNVWVLTYAANQTNVGVFWGLDPRNSNGQVTTGGNTYYIYNVGPSGRSSDLTLEQSGWLRNPGTGLPDPPVRQGLFLNLNQSLPVTSSGYINFGSPGGVSRWTNYDSTPLFSVTSGGRIHFAETGQYIMRVGLGMDSGGVSSVAWGTSAGDGAPAVASFTYSYPWRVATNPSTPTVFPMNITDINSNVYVYAYGTGSNFVANSYISINKADYCMSISSPYGPGVALRSTGSATVPLYSNIVNTGSAFATFATDGSNKFTINGTGQMLVTGTIYMESNYVSNVQLMEGSNTLYTYDMSAQGRDPTFTFSMPVNATDISQLYYINVATANNLTTSQNFPNVTPTGTGSTRQWTVQSHLGVFLMNASTESSTQPAWKGFKTGDYWVPASTSSYVTSGSSPYSNTTSAPVTNTLPGPVSRGGEWIQLVSPVNIILTSVTITPASPDLAPGECYILGNTLESDSGWTILNGPTNLNGSAQTVTVSGASEFKWFRVVFTKVLSAVSGAKPSVNLVLTGKARAAVMLNNSFFIISQIGLASASASASTVLPYNGIMLRPSTTTLESPLKITTDFTALGNVFNISNITDANTLSFSNVGMYTLTGAICTADQITSVTISDTLGGNLTYPISLGMLPPYTVNMPFRVSNTAAQYSISLTTNGVTAAPNLFSTTFLAVYPLSSNVSVVSSYNYYDSVATLAVKTAELKIGGQSIETLTGEYIELWNDLNVSYENQPALKLLTGKGDEATQILNARTYYLNLPFYFFNRPELAIPLVSLYRQDVEIHVNFNTFSNLTAVTGIVNPTLDATIITEYVYLSEPEINWFRTSRVEQVITQRQYASFLLPANFTSGVFNLDFRNPIREMFFVIQIDGTLPYDYSLNGLQSIGLSFNGYEAMSTSTNDSVSLGSLEPFNHYPNFPTRKFYMHSFCTNPGNTAPSGYVNFSRIKQALLTVNADPNTQNRQLRLAFVSHNVLRFENGLAGLMFNSG